MLIKHNGEFSRGVLHEQNRNKIPINMEFKMQKRNRHKNAKKIASQHPP